MSAGKRLEHAFEQNRVLAEKRKQVQRETVDKAARNVIDGTCDSCEDAARGQQVPPYLVVARVKALRAGVLK
jgi:hypothetical protein